MKKSLSEIIKSRLDEASFSSANLEKVSRLYGKLITKYFNSTKEFKCISNEKFKSGSRSGVGFRFINADGYQLRFNYESKQNKFNNSESFVVSSLDFWEPDDFKNFDKPTKTVFFSRALNVVQILKKIINCLKEGKTGKINLLESFHVDLDNILNEAKAGEFGWAKYLGSPKMRAEFAKKMGWDDPESYGVNVSDKRFNAKLGNFNYKVVPKWEYEEEWGERPDEENFSKEWAQFVAEIKPGSKEANTLQEEIEKLENNFELVTSGYADPDIIFDDMEKLLDVFANRDLKALIVAGDPGLGKTFRIKEYLKQRLEAKDWDYVPAPATSLLDIYETLLMNSDKIILFDESEKMFQGETLNFFKTLLDSTSTKYGTEVSYSTNMLKVPNDPEWLAAYCKVYRQCLESGKYNARREKTVNAEFADLLQMDPKAILAFGEDLGPNLQFNQAIMDKNPNLKPFLPTPGKFLFSGSCLFITNVPLKDINTAIISRAFAMDLTFSIVDKYRILAQIDSKTEGISIQEATKRWAYIAEKTGNSIPIDSEGKFAKNPNMVYREAYGTQLTSLRLASKVKILEKYYPFEQAVDLLVRYGY